MAVIRLLKYVAVALAAMVLCPSPAVHGRKINYGFSKSKTRRHTTTGQSEQPVSAVVKIEFNPADTIVGTIDRRDIKFSRYDKARNSDKETIFVSNHTDHDLAGCTIEIEYLGAGGVLLHKRMVELDMEIPSGESRKIDFKSFDTQHSFYYRTSRAGRLKGTPYDIRINLCGICFYAESLQNPNYQ